MSTIFKKLTQVFTTPDMLPAYSNWFFSTNFLGHPPFVYVNENYKIGSWISFSEYWAYRKGITEAEKLLIQHQLLDREDSKHPSVAIDIGANIGLFTVYLGSLDYDNVYSFEPVPQTFKRLSDNTSINVFAKELKINCLAIGEQEGFVDFKIFDDSPGTNQLLVSTDENTHDNSIRVPVITLDKYCADNKINEINFLKIDVEGMEPFVIRGASRMLKNKLVKKTLIEICPNQLKATGNSVDILYESIIDVGYLPYALLSNGKVGSVLSIDELRAITLANIVLLPLND